MHSFPLTLQHDSMLCGIACLQMESLTAKRGAYYKLVRNQLEVGS